MTNHTLVDHYDVIWNGAHHGQDLDLLSNGLARVTEKRSGTSPARISATALVEAVLVAHHAPLAMRQIVEVAGISVQTATAGLYNLRLQGRLGSQDISGSRAPVGGRPGKEYWLLESEAAR